MEDNTITITSVQYCAGRADISGDLYAEDDADRIRFWSDDMCILEVKRLGSREWNANVSDVWSITREDQYVRELDAADVLRDLAKHRGMNVVLPS